MYRFRRSSLVFSVLALLLFGFSQAAFAQSDYDPPDRVARLNYLRGNVSFLPSDGDPNDWVSAMPNRPMTTGDRMWADRDGRAELHIGSTALRIDANTGLSFLNLNDNVVQLQLSAGSLIIRVRRMDSSDSFEVETPNLAFNIQQPGTYRIDVSADGNRTVVIVRQGYGVATGGGRSYNILSDQQAMFTGGDYLEYDLMDADRQPMSEFDSWVADRDRREDHISSTRYVSAEVTGYEDLDGNGDWDRAPEYGAIWYPRNIQAGWAPYRFGHWIWVFPWGWTWVDDMPWGFAPFHYGRWVSYRNRWGWVPGPIVARPSYCPALVAWVGGGPGFNFSVSFGVGGGIAWFPLGPREVFVPNYRVSDRYVTRVNISNTVVERTTVVNIYHNTNNTQINYINRRAPGGVTAVSHETFVNARPVGRNVVNVPQNEIERAPITRALPAEPDRRSRQGAGQQNAPQPPPQIMNRPVVTERGQPRVNRPVMPGEGQPPQGGAGQQPPPNQDQRGRGNQPQQQQPPQNPPGRGNEDRGRGNQQPPPQQQQVPPPQPPPPQQQQQQQQPPPPQKQPPQRPPEQAPPERQQPPVQTPPQQQQVPPPPSPPQNPRGRGNERPPEQAPPERQQPPPPQQQQQQVPPQPPQPRGGGGQQPPNQDQRGRGNQPPPVQVPPQQLPPQRQQPPQPPPQQQAPPPVPVKQAPPVRPPTQQENTNEKAKQAEWEKAHPRPPQTPPPAPPKKDDKTDDKNKGRGRGGSGGSDH
jgi:hypothetical protein